MIMFDFQCTECEHLFEEFDRMDNEDLKECPECATLSAIRVPSSIKLYRGLPFGNGRVHENVQE